MPLTRRHFLAASTALAALPRMAMASGQTQITAATATVQLAPDGYAATQVWAYNGAVPGQMLRFAQGDTLDVRLVNGLTEQETTIHWHGLRLPNAMDGVPGLTQSPVAPVPASIIASNSMMPARSGTIPTPIRLSRSRAGWRAFSWWTNPRPRRWTTTACWCWTIGAWPMMR